MGERDRGDRPKKSWRELDAQRDRAGSSTRTPSVGPRGASPSSADRSSKQYRAALDALFAKGEVGKLAEKLSPPPSSTARSAPTPPDLPEPPPAPPSARRSAAESAPRTPDPADEARAVLRKKILAAIGRDEISRAVDRYVKAHGLPADFEILEQALEHQKPERVAEVLATLDALLSREKPKRSRTLAGKLRFIEETSNDADLSARATAIRGKLGT